MCYSEATNSHAQTADCVKRPIVWWGLGCQYAQIDVNIKKRRGERSGTIGVGRRHNAWTYSEICISHSVGKRRIGSRSRRPIRVQSQILPGVTGYAKAVDKWIEIYPKECSAETENTGVSDLSRHSRGGIERVKAVRTAHPVEHAVGSRSAGQ